MPDDFTPLDGSSDEPPVAASHAVDVWFRMGRSSGNPKPAGAWHWGHSGGPGDIPRSAAMARMTAFTIPDDWVPTAAAINALPLPLRR
jgi:hypothetical protein